MKTEVATVDVEKKWKRNVVIVKEFIKSFGPVGIALREIRDEQQYKKHYMTFEEACREEFGYSKSHSYRLIDEATALEELKKSPVGDKVSSDVLKERHVRALVSCADDTDSRVKIINAIEKSGRPITESEIRKTADEILPPKIKETPKPEKAKEPEVEEIRDKRTTFNPEDFDTEVETDEPVKQGPSLFEKKLLLIEQSIDSTWDSLGPLIRQLDSENDQQAIPNYKSIVGHFKRFHKELDESRTTLIQLVKAWKFRK